MDLDGPVTVFRWPGGAEPPDESVVFAASLTTILEVPYGQGKRAGKDHAEGMTLFAPEGGAAQSILVVYDSAAKERLAKNAESVEADIFSL